MQNSTTQEIIYAFNRMELLKLDGLNTPIRVETYAFFASKADTLLHKKLFENGKLSDRDIALITKARQEYRRSQKLLSTYSTGLPSNESQNISDQDHRREVVREAIDMRESRKFDLYAESALAIK